MILVVDDDPHRRRLVRLLLEGDGHRVHEAEDGARALALLAGGLRPSLLLTDLRMPLLDGRALLLAIARAPALGEGLTTVLVTAEGLVEPELRALCSEVLRKPITADALLTLAARATRPPPPAG